VLAGSTAPCPFESELPSSKRHATAQEFEMSNFVR
jgi:hypothetical protein